MPVAEQSHLRVGACAVQEQSRQFLEQLKSGTLAVAVSGGSDSMAVLHAIWRANEGRRSLVCFTVDHQLRPEAKKEAEFVASFCGDLGITHKILTWEGQKPANGLQQAAREARYELLAHACAEASAIGIVTGHTLDDQLETLAMRGKRDPALAGKGMAGMAPATLFQRSLWVMRPFLSVSKTSLRRYAQNYSVDWIEDPSNNDQKFERVRVRRSKHVPNFLDGAQTRQIERAELAHSVAEYVSRHTNIMEECWAKLYLEAADLKVQQCAIECLIDVIGGRERQLGAAQLDKLRDFLACPLEKKLTMGRTIVKRRDSVISIEREKRGLEELVVPAGQKALWDNRFMIENQELESSILVRADPDRKGFPPMIGCLDADGDIVERAIGGYVKVSRYINRFDQVASSFDLELANALAKLFGRLRYLQMPVVAETKFPKYS